MMLKYLKELGESSNCKSWKEKMYYRQIFRCIRNIVYLTLIDAKCLQKVFIQIFVVFLILQN